MIIFINAFNRSFSGRGVRMQIEKRPGNFIVFVYSVSQSVSRWVSELVSQLAC